MQTVTCSVALAGDLNNVRVFDALDEITVPEVMVMRALHGDDAVTNIKAGASIKRSNQEEVARLTQKYDWNKQNEGQTQIVQKLFPGARPNLPTTLASLEGDSDEADEDEADDKDAPPTAKGKKANRSAALD